VREIDHAPVVVVKVGGRRARAIAGLGQIAEETAARVKIPGWVIGIAKGKAPVKVHQQPLAAAGGGVW
jgi:hypothetical protein